MPVQVFDTHLCARENIILKETKTFFQRERSRLHSDLLTPPTKVLRLHWTVLGTVILTVKLATSHFHILSTTHRSLPCLHSLLSSREAQVSKNDYIYTIVSLHSSQYTADDCI